MSGWRPSCDVQVAARRAELLANARSYFADRSVLAVDTPSLSANAVTDPQIESIAVGSTAAKRYLHTSPEFCMKRLLAAGYPDIYSVCRVFRGGERGKWHLPEFTMIEWYRRNFDLQDIVDDTIGFIATLLQRPELQQTAQVLDYQSLFVNRLNIDPLAAKIDQLADVAGADNALRASLADRRDAWLDLLMMSKIAPEFRASSLTVVQHYPATQAALARLCPANEQVADRFEVFYGTVELANGYVELSDATEQARRMQEDLQQRKQLGLPLVPIDDSLLSALKSGLPDCAGVALGFERLHMLDARTDDIHNVVTFT